MERVERRFALLGVEFPGGDLVGDFPGALADRFGVLGDYLRRGAAVACELLEGGGELTLDGEAELAFVAEPVLEFGAERGLRIFAHALAVEGDVASRVGAGCRHGALRRAWRGCC